MNCQKLKCLSQIAENKPAFLKSQKWEAIPN